MNVLVTSLVVGLFIGFVLVVCDAAGRIATSIERIAQILNRMEGK